MTNQEAIKILKIERDHMTPTLFAERIEAIDMAISALQAQDLQSSCNQFVTDTISRQTVLDAIEKIEDEVLEGFGFQYEKWKQFFMNLPSEQPEPCDDAVSRQDIYELIDDVAYDVDATKCNWYHTIYKRAKKLPSVQSEPSQVARDIADIIENEKDMRVIARSEITDEQAILHLQASGWMQRHDKEMYESGLRARLTDDSDSYDALLESAQPEIIHCKDCKWKQGSECVRFSDVRPFPNDFCSRAERRTDESD